MNAYEFLLEIGACNDALEWSKHKSKKEAWETCPRGDWMLYIASKLNVDKKKIFIIKALIAHQVIHLMRDQRSRNAVRAAFLYGRGKISKKELDAAAADANDVYFDNDADVAADLAVDSDDVYYDYPFDIIEVVANAAYDDAYDNYTDNNYAVAAEQISLEKSADICRKILTSEIQKYF